VSIHLEISCPPTRNSRCPLTVSFSISPACSATVVRKDVFSSLSSSWEGAPMLEGGSTGIPNGTRAEPASGGWCGQTYIRE